MKINSTLVCRLPIPTGAHVGTQIGADGAERR